MQFGRTWDEFKSDGKTLELIPIITMPGGETFMLPPVRWDVPNELLGFMDSHPVGTPNMVEYMQNQTYIQGSNAAYGSRLSFIIRILEYSPGSEPHAAPAIDMNTVRALLKGIKAAVK